MSLYIICTCYTYDISTMRKLNKKTFLFTEIIEATHYRWEANDSNHHYYYMLVMTRQSLYIQYYMNCWLVLWYQMLLTPQFHQQDLVKSDSVLIIKKNNTLKSYVGIILYKVAIDRYT